MKISQKLLIEWKKDKPNSDVLLMLENGLKLMVYGNEVKSNYINKYPNYIYLLFNDV